MKMMILYKIHLIENNKNKILLLLQKKLKKIKKINLIATAEYFYCLY